MMSCWCLHFLLVHLTCSTFDCGTWGDACWSCACLGGLAVLAHTGSSKITMNASSLLVPSPFGRAFLHAPPWLQETLRHHGFGPHQSDGHVLVHSCIRPATQADELVLEDIGSRVTWTTTFGYILNTALTRTGGGDPAAGDHMEVHQQMLELLAKVRGGPDPTAYTERQLRWEIVDRERWLNSFIPAPITDLKLVKWRHWKPSRIKELGPINQKVLEGHLRRKWAERLLAHLTLGLPPWSFLRGSGSGNTLCLWSVRSIPSQATAGGNLYSHGLVYPSTPALKKATIWYPPSVRMVWASLPGLVRLIGLSAGLKMHWVGGGFTFSRPHLAQLSCLHPRLCIPTWNLTGTGWQNQQQMSTPGKSSMWWSRYGMKWPTISRRSPWEDGWSVKTSVTLIGRVCPWPNHPHQRRAWRTHSSAVVSPPKDQPPPLLEEDESGEIQEVPPLPEEMDSTIPSKTPADKLGHPHGPLRVVASSRKSGPTGTYKIHLLTVDHKAVGCGWQPSALKARDLNPRSVCGASSFTIFPLTGLWNRQLRKKIRRDHHLRRTVSLMTQWTQPRSRRRSHHQTLRPPSPTTPSERSYPPEEGGCSGARRQENPAGSIYLRLGSLSDGPLRIGWILGPPDRDHCGLDPEHFWSHLTPANRPELHKLAPKHRRKKYCCFCCLGAVLVLVSVGLFSWLADIDHHYYHHLNLSLPKSTCWIFKNHPAFTTTLDFSLPGKCSKNTLRNSSGYLHDRSTIAEEFCQFRSRGATWRVEIRAFFWKRRRRLLG